MPETRAKRLRQDWVDENWNRASLEMAVATGWLLLDSKWAQGKWRGISGWLTGAAPFSSRGQLLFHLRYDNRRAVGVTEATDLFVFGLKGYVGSSTFNVFGELAGQHDSDAAISSEKNTLAWSGGIEFQLRDGIWLSTGLGSHMTGDDDGNTTFVIANMRWGVGRAPRIGPPTQ